METTSITIEIPIDLADQIEHSGGIHNTEFITSLLKIGLTHFPEPKFSQEEMLAAADATYGLCADEDWTMDDIRTMKQEEREIEDRKLNRL